MRLIIIALCLILLVLLHSVPSQSQTYNPEDRWIGKAIRKQLRNEDRDERRNLIIEYRRHRDHRDHRHYGYRHEHDHSRVYGMTIRRLDTTGHVGCYPGVEAYSVEANTEDGAWTDAQRNWENQVRAMVGERWMEVRNAREVEKQCWASSGNQSVAGRMTEKVGAVVQSITGNEGGVDGRKHRCRILAKPCQAPKEVDPATKGDKQ